MPSAVVQGAAGRTSSFEVLVSAEPGGPSDLLLWSKLGLAGPAMSGKFPDYAALAKQIVALAA